MSTTEEGHMAEAVRADARRNYEILLSVAREAFAEHGTDASLREVARRAGVGIGTLYRHFPTREALLEAMFRSGFDDQRRRAEELLASASPREALLTWLSEFAVNSTVFRGLPESVMAALGDERSELHSSCQAMRAAAGRLLERAQRSGGARADVTVNDLLALTAGVAWASQHTSANEGTVERLLSLAMNGFARD
jgi:AcrR family transcriptional regulator